MNKLSDIVKNFPTKNSFKDFSSPDPTNNDFTLYTLPDYLRPYVNDLLLRINTSTSNLPLQLFPYIQFDSALNRFVPIELSLNLPSLQKLDHLLNKDKTPNFLTSLTDRVKKKRNQSNDAWAHFIFHFSFYFETCTYLCVNYPPFLVKVIFTQIRLKMYSNIYVYFKLGSWSTFIAVKSKWFYIFYYVTDIYCIIIIKQKHFFLCKEHQPSNC